ncbi:MAG: CBS domain-containing protein [Spirochaetia bacterium]|nr:CBS domain-containing protein [Spirochaetia bacterium]
MKTEIKESSTFKSFIKKLFGKNGNVRDELTDFFEDHEIPVSNDQLQMIMGILRLIGFKADKIKIPLPNVVSLPLKSSKENIVSVIIKSGHSRIPVYDENKGRKEFIGLIYAKDLLKAFTEKKKSIKLKEYLRPLQIVPEGQSLLSLLREMRLKQHHLMMTVNEYGEFTGLITLEDILEEIVGEIRDEFDRKKAPIKEIGLRLYRVDALLPLSDINNELAINLPEEKFSSLAGFLLHELKGELKNKAKVVYGQIEITVEKFAKKQIKKAIIKIPPNISHE